MSTIAKKSAVKKGNVNAKNVGSAIEQSQTVKLPTVNKKMLERIVKVETFDAKNASNIDRLRDTSNRVHIANMGMNKMIRTFIEEGVNLTQAQKDCLTFDNVKNYIATSKYKDLALFSVYQMQCICSAVIRENHKATRLAERAQKQGAIIGKKADALGK